MRNPGSVKIARALFFIVCELLAIGLALSSGDIDLWLAVLGGCLLAAFVILIESLMQDFTLRGFSTATFGLLVGLFCGWLVTRVGFTQLFELMVPEELASFVRASMDAAIYASLGFIGTTLALRSDRDDFAFIVPYVRFRQDVASGQPIVLDAEAVIDGRLTRVLGSGLMNGRLIVPDFILDFLNEEADAPETVQRDRARRGLAALESMQNDAKLEVAIHRATLGDGEIDLVQELLNVARLLGARILTNDERTTKVARLQGIDVVSLNELGEALRPNVEVGERVRLSLIKPGKEENQTVGYLSDGSMVVVNDSAQYLGQSVDCLVISTLSTNSGRMVFAEILNGVLRGEG